jgi:hypothetical protein
VTRDFARSPGETHDAQIRWWIWGETMHLTGAGVE